MAEYNPPPDRQYKDDKPKKGDFTIILNIKGIKNKPEECLILVTPTDRSLDVLVTVKEKGKSEVKHAFTLDPLPYKIDSEKTKWTVNKGKSLEIVLKKQDKDNKWATPEFLETVLVPKQAKPPV